MTRSLITGGAGFIGGHLAEILRQEGHEVVAFDNLLAGDNNLPLLQSIGAEFVKGDIRDVVALREAMKGVDEVYHLAAMNRAMRSIEDPIQAHEINSTGTLNVLEVCREMDVDRVVYTSSSSVYGSSPNFPRKEDDVPAPKHPYAVGKLTGEHYSTVYHMLYGLDVTTIRYFSVYGPRQRPDIKYAAVVPKFVHAILTDQPLTVYGSGAQKRNFTFVKDAARGTRAAMSSKSAVGAIMNIGGSKGISINELITILSEITERKPTVVHEDPQPGDIMENPPDISRAMKLIGYDPEIPIEEGLIRTVNYWHTMI